MVAPPKPGTVVHVEIQSPAPEKTQKFYEHVFGWKFAYIPEMKYWTFEAPGRPNGGLMVPMEGMGPTVLNYILSADINKTTKLVQEAGGSIVVPRTEIPNMGLFAIFRDPAGVSQGVYEELQKPRAAPRKKARARSKGRKRGR